MKAHHCRAILGHEEPFWVKKAILVLFWAILGPPWASEKAPDWSRLVQHDIISCNIPVRSILRPFGVMQGNFGS